MTTPKDKEFRCSSHEALLSQVVETRTIAAQTLAVVQRLEGRVEETGRRVSHHSGAFGIAKKSVGWIVGIFGLVIAAVTLISRAIGG